MRARGFGNNEISVVARHTQGQGQADQEAGADVSEGVTWGGALGGIAGLLAGVGALALPGVGPIVAAGPLAATLGGAVTGGVAGGLLDLGIPENRGRFYEEEVKRGRLLAVVQTDTQRIDEASQILRDHGAANVESHVGSQRAARVAGNAGAEKGTAGSPKR